MDSLLLNQTFKSVIAKIVYCCAFNFLLMFGCFADPNLSAPIFANQWFLNRYEATDVTSYANSCDIPTYQYKYSNNSSDSLAQLAFNEAPKHTDCKWDNMSSDSSTAIPISFPGTPQQWNDIFNQGSSNVTKEYRSNCKNKQGDVIDYFSVYIYPVYNCQKGSRQFDSADGCVTNPPVCEADVVGRDFGSFPLEPAGHVGLASAIPDISSPVLYDSQVLEVLNKSPYIFNNTFDSFAHNPEGTFWGEVYGLAAKPELSYSDASDIIAAGEDQIGLGVSYTKLPIAKPNQLIQVYIYDHRVNSFVSQKIEIGAKFRCDTFVEYVYQKGINLLPTPMTFYLTPASVYNAFSNKRDSFPIPVNSSSISRTNQIYEPALTDCNTADCYQNQIDELLSSTQADVDKLYDTSNQYIKFINNASISNQFLYQEAVKYQTDNQRYVLMIQILEEQQPLSILNNMVDDYKKNHDSYFSVTMSSNNSELLLTIAETISFKTDTDIKKLTVQDIQAIINAQNLFIDILENSMDKDEVIEAINLAQNVLPEDQAFELIYEAEQRLHIHNNSLLMQTFIISHIFNQSSADNRNLQNDIHSFILQNKLSTQQFNKKLFAMINNATTNVLNKKLKLQLIQYVKTQIPICLNQDKPDEACLLEFTDWTNASSNLYQFNTQQKYTFILTTLLGIKNINAAANIFIGYNPLKFKNIDNQFLIKFKNKLAQNIDLKNQQQFLIEDMAVKNLNTLLNDQHK